MTRTRARILVVSPVTSPPVNPLAINHELYILKYLVAFKLCGVCCIEACPWAAERRYDRSGPWAGFRSKRHLSRRQRQPKTKARGLRIWIRPCSSRSFVSRTTFCLLLLTGDIRRPNAPPRKLLRGFGCRVIAWVKAVDYFSWRSTF